MKLLEYLLHRVILRCEELVTDEIEEDRLQPVRERVVISTIRHYERFRNERVMDAEDGRIEPARE